MAGKSPCRVGSDLCGHFHSWTQFHQVKSNKLQDCNVWKQLKRLWRIRNLIKLLWGHWGLWRVCDVHGPTATFSCKNSPPMCLLQHSHGTRISQVDGLKGENQTSEFRTVMWVDWHWPKKGFTHALNSSFSDHWPVSVQYWKRREEKEICN